MKVIFQDVYGQTVTFEVAVIKNDTFVKDKQSQVFRNFLNNHENFKIKAVEE